MPGNPREMTPMAERRFPVRIRIGIPPSGFGQRHTQMTAWLDENCGSDGWAMTPSGLRGVLNDAVSIYFLDTILASASIIISFELAIAFLVCSLRREHVHFAVSSRLGLRSDDVMFPACVAASASPPSLVRKLIPIP